jgi:hypothetical protein
MQRKWVRNIVHRYLLRGRFFWWGKDLKEDCVESSLRLCLGTLVLPYKDQLFLRSSTFLLQILFLRHDLEQLNAGLSWSCTVPSSPGHAIHVHMLVMGQPHASRHVIRHSGLRGPITPSSEVCSKPGSLIVNVGVGCRTCMHALEPK